MNTLNEFNIKYEVMTRVRTVRSIRAILMSPGASALIGITIVGYLSIIVSLGDVFANTMAHADWPNRLYYAFSSLVHSTFTVQTLAGLLVIIMLYVMVNSIRKIPVRKILFVFGSAQ